MRQIQIFVPKDKHSEIIKFLQDTLELTNLFSVKGDTNAQISFRVNESQSLRIVEALKQIGVGVEYGLIDILPIIVSVPLIEEEKEEIRVSSLEARVVTEALYKSISEDARISLDYLWFIVISAFIAGLGILQNSTVAVVASMLLAPLMGPILGFSLSVVVKDQKLSKDSLFAEGSGLGLALVSGLVLGLVTWSSQPDTLPEQMTARGNPGLVDLCIALLSGLAIAYALGRGTTSSLVGVAIAASLMPPAVNIGIALMWGEWAIVVGSSLLLIANIILIDIAAIGMFYLMDIKPVGVLESTWTGLTEEQVGSRWSRMFNRKKTTKKPVQPIKTEPTSHEAHSETELSEDEGILARLRGKKKVPATTDVSNSEQPVDNDSNHDNSINEPESSNEG